MVAEVVQLRVPPHSVEAEQAVLGALMLDARPWPRVAKMLKVGDFFRRDHQRIFEIVSKIADAGRILDAVTVNDALEREGYADEVGGLVYLAGLVRNTPSAANIEAYAAAVRDRSLLRQLQSFADGVNAGTAGGRPAADLVADAQEALLRLQSSAHTGRGLVSVKELTGELLDDLERRKEGTKGTFLGLSDFDELTGGLEPGDLVVLAGRPGMGKTALLVSIDCHVSLESTVAVFSAEMSAQQLMRRHVSLLSGVSQKLLRRAEQMQDADWAGVAAASSQIVKRRLFIDDTPAPSLTHIRAECMALKAKGPLGLVLVDYMQLVQGSGENRYQQLRDVAYGFKALGKDLAAPIIVLAQLNRGVESRDNKRPHISDLRDSGAIEEAADIIGLLYSEGYYNADFSMPYVLECLLAKNRNAERGECLWNFTGAHSRVEVLNPGAKAQYRQLRAKAASRRRGSSDGDDV